MTECATMASDMDSSAGKENWLVRDIVIGRLDSRGQRIEYIYSKVKERFAIYLADDKIWIQYADEGQTAADGSDLGENQRKALAPLRSLRGQIDGFVRKLWVTLHPMEPLDKAEIKFYNQRVADSLFNALQGNVDAALVELAEVRAEILDRLRSLGRLQFARATLAATLITLTVLTLAILFAARVETLVTPGPMTPLLDSRILTFISDQYFWAAALFGSLGAWFSIALNLRRTDPTVSTSPLDNLVDPVLRIVIAIIAAVILFTMVRLQFFAILIGDEAVNWATDTSGQSGSERGLYVAIFLAFLAGFSERLVGNMLDSTARANEPMPAPAGATGQGARASENDPLGRSGAGQGRGPPGGGGPAGGGGPQPGDDDPDPPPPDPATLEADATPDEDLPPSRGGEEGAAPPGGGRV
jgi:uncharacterized membrane protein YgcG